MKSKRWQQMHWPIMGNTDKNKPKKFRRKIRIRLTDPNIPDSYICEIFDSSLDTEDDELSRNDNTSEKGKDDPSKPKNYFDLLMSKNCKKNYIEGNDAAKISHNVDVDDDNDDDDDDYGAGAHNKTFQKRKKKFTKRTRNSLGDSINAKRKEMKCNYELSENESFLKVQSKIKTENMVLNEDNECKKNFNEKNVRQNDNLVTIFDSPKIDLTRRKTLSILNYFSKTEISPNNNLKFQKEESSIAELKMSESKNLMYHSDKNDSKKSFNNGARQVLNRISKENIKLAPLFCKNRNNSVLDSVKQKAQLEFLDKGSSFAVKKSETKVPEIFYFHAVTHVQQRNENVCWSLRQICLPVHKMDHSECIFSDNKKFSLQIKQSPVVNKAVPEGRIDFTKELLGKIKFKYLKLNLDSVIDGLKAKRDRFSAQIKKIQNSQVISSKSSNSELEYEELNTLWTEKYKPKSNEFLGNANAVKKLRKWLQSWQCFNDELRLLAKSSQGSKSKRDSTEDDEDEFLDFANKNYGLKVPSNVCIISGPNGCGKSALVYALANELEFNILELNASSKRTGKKVLTDVQEATRSHKVHRVNFPQPIAVQGEEKKKKIKIPKKAIKSESVEVTDQSKDCRISLILIEDADIVYDDHDEGFYSAIASLVQTSKRPLIFLTNEPNFAYLENLKADQCLKLKMEPPSFYKSCALLDVVSSLEGVHFEREILESVLRQNSFDLRRSLLELQFWIGSGENIKNREKIFDLGHLWWGLSKFLFNQEVTHLVKCKGRKRKRENDLFDSSDDEEEWIAKKFKPNPEDTINIYCGEADAFAKISDSSIESYFRVLDVASTLDGFCVTRSREPLPGNEYRPKDSLALCENMEDVSWGSRLTEELSEEMMSLSARIFSGSREAEEESLDKKISFVSPCWEEVRWRRSQAKASEELSGLVSLQKRGDKRSLYLDYLPILRNICRMERHRSKMNPKRKNRFYHYLNNFGSEPREENLEINCQVFNR